MITEKAIASRCNQRSMTRGRAIASSDRNILTKQVRYDAEESVVSAFVASSSGWDDRYRTSVILDEEADVVLDWSCTCPAFREYAGMCKHCVALTLAFSHRPETFMGYQAQRTAQSSSCITEFMKRTEELQADDTPAESVVLRAELSYGYGLWSASFRISGPSATPYVVKSLSEFAERMRSGARHAYGKKLAFTHSPAVFEQRSRGMAQFIERACSMREAADDAPSWLRRQSASVGRTLQLSEAEAVELFGLLDGAEFSISGADYATPTVQRVHIEHSDPDISLAMAPADNGGWTIERGEHIRMAEQAGRLYIWCGDDTVHRCSPAFARCSDFLRTVYDSDERNLFVANADMPLFCAAALPIIEENLHLSAPSELSAWRPVECKLAFFLDKNGKNVVIGAQAAYGPRRFTLCGSVPADHKDEKSASGPSPLRDARAEGKAKALVESYFGPGQTRIPMSNEEAIANLIFTGLGQLREAGEVYTTPAFDRLIKDGKPRLSMGVSLSGNLINLTVDAGDLGPEELAAMLGSYRKKKRYHRLRDGAFVDLSDFELAQLDRLASDLGITQKELATGTVELPSFRAFYLDEEADLDRDRSFTQYLSDFRAIDERVYQVPEGLNATLRPYQAEGLRWLSARLDAGFGGVLADEMGLGKSVQLISLLVARADQAREVGPSLIVCPSSLVYNWMAEFERFAPGLNVAAVVGSAAERKVIRGHAFAPYDASLVSGRKGRPAPSPADADDALPSDSAAASQATVQSTGNRPAPVDVLITSYDLARIDSADYAGRELFICALDEAQYIKNPATLTTRAVKRLSARHRFALTGTPMENRLSELWSIFDFLMPGLLGPYARFRERFELPIVGGEEDVAARLSAVVGPFLLRRRKADVLTDLPEKLESVVYAPMEGQQLKLYRAHEQRLREELTRQRRERKQRQAKRDAGEHVSSVEVLAELMQLRQLCCDPRLLFEGYRGHGAKLDTIMELVASAMEGGEKTLIFSQFTSFLDLIAQRLDEAGIAFYTITGKTPKRDRVELVNEFNGNDVPVFLVSLKAGGTGLNLTGASVVIHADPWWNAAAQQQATDRAHRIGQTRVVSVQKVIAKGTIEERILHLQEEKSKLADQVIGSSGISLASLSADELMNLLEG